MLIVCPACGARYAVDDALIGPTGRVVRCSGCDSEWTFRPDDAAQATRAGGERGRTAVGRAPPASIAPCLAEPTAGEDASPHASPPELAASNVTPRDRALAATLEEPRARRGGDGFLAGFLLATTAALLAALAYLRADDIVAAAPSLEPQIEAYRAWVDAARADIAAALAAAR